MMPTVTASLSPILCRTAGSSNDTVERGEVYGNGRDDKEVRLEMV